MRLIGYRKRKPLIQIRGKDSRPEALPSVKLSHGLAIPDIEVHKEIDPQTGDLILHNYGGYVDTLDGLL